MIWVTRVHYSYSTSVQVSAIENDGNFVTSQEIAKSAIEGYGVGDIDHVEVIGIPDENLRNWVSFDVKTVLENQDGK